MKEKQSVTLEQILELRERLSKKFGEEELREVAEEFREIRQASEHYKLSDREKRSIELFLMVIQVSVPPRDELEASRN